jgi:subtilisin-like proprotein convertase family protein
MLIYSHYNVIFRIYIASQLLEIKKMNKTLLFLIFALAAFNPPQTFPQPQNTFCRNGLSIPIPDHSIVRDSLTVSLGTGCQILDVNIFLDTVLHTWLADLSVYIQKSNVGVKVIDNVGGSSDDFINVILDDSATSQIRPPPITGRFRPSNPLTPFNGLITDGVWRILITDTAGGDTGMLKAWCVQLVYQCPTGGIQTVEIPNSYRLYQNYPNPFNPETIIKYGIPISGNVKLSVYDVNEHKEANLYEVKFDASKFSSGIYFYRLESGDFAQTKKMLLVK